MTNIQPIEPKQPAIDDTIDVHSMWRTIQGEGPYVGVPATFIRLAGCNLQCPFCDTDYTSTRERMTAADAIAKLNEIAPVFNARPLVVITGGEPFRQNITMFVQALLRTQATVQIETNGTLFLDDFPYRKVTIVCSPKTKKLHPEMLKNIDAYKYVVEHGKIGDNGLPSSALGMPDIPAAPPSTTLLSDIYIQPLDSKDKKQNEANMQAAVDSCLQYGYTLCLQIQKIAGLA